MVQLSAFLHSMALTALARLRDERGQATVEYALVVLGAAAVALALVAWAAKTGKLSALFDRVLNSVTGKVE
ncbi:MAG: DUF4244 domain-containing protein [Acidimicrobiia bacterium]|nr:DUF4244 domain-containing protein [Acidimicrobiia bacterium]